MEPCAKEQEFGKIDAQITTIFKRIDEQLQLSKAMYDLVAEVRVIAAQVHMMTEQQEKTNKDIEELKAQPKKLMEMIVGALVGAVITGSVGFLFLQFGMK